MVRSGMLLIALVFTLVSAAAVEAVVLRTAPFPGDSVFTGLARCGVTNAGTATGTFTSMTLFSNTGALHTTPGFALSPHITATTDASNLVNDSPTYCECVVPSMSTWRCAFQFINGDHAVTVIGAP
ncbi:MAG TPA: hypothetical protein VGT40_16085 [Methylomirabilota bacterium]|jgi:hypothetical protein|nr:hypothetical protein [Methylomirabilota bacterium]